jgi:hypothetical protein
MSAADKANYEAETGVDTSAGDSRRLLSEEDHIDMIHG